MKFPAVVVAIFALLTVSSEASAASVRVNVNNDINSGFNSYSSETRTKVNISQDGEGTSSVKVNGKEWSLEGPGEISVDESSDSNSSPTLSPTENPTNTPTQIPSSESPTPTDGEELDSAPEEIHEFPALLFKEMVENLLNSFNVFISNVFWWN